LETLFPSHDRDAKKCRIQDYKVNADFSDNGKEKIINLPKEIKLDGNKVSKLSLQLKFHARMLEKSGWTVEGFDGFVYDGKWNYYEANELAGLDILTGKMIN
jgi:cobyrinic acid a,c-diamide synthase